MGNQPWPQFQNGIRERSIAQCLICDVPYKSSSYPGSNSALGETNVKVEIVVVLLFLSSSLLAKTFKLCFWSPSRHRIGNRGPQCFLR